MFHKAVIGGGKDWDKKLPYLLFAYREVPQASTGFHPLSYFMDVQYMVLWMSYVRPGKGARRVVIASTLM